MKTNEKTLKDHYYQLSENIFEKREIKKLISIYGHTGYYWWSIIEIDLLKNNGIADKNWRYYSTTSSPGMGMILQNIPKLPCKEEYSGSSS